MTSPIISFVYAPRYQKELPAAGKRQEREAGHVESVSRDLDDVNILVYIDSVQSVPTVAHLLQLFAAGEGAPTGVALSALRIVETTDRSSVLLATQSTLASQADPALQVASFLGNLMGVPTKTFLSTSPSHRFGDEVNKILAESGSNFLLIPWHYRGETHSIPHEISCMASESAVTTAIFVDQDPAGGTWFTRGKRGFHRGVLLPFVGGMDDREALRVALRLYRNHSTLSLCVVFGTQPTGIPATRSAPKTRSCFSRTVSDDGEAVEEDAAALARLKHVAAHEGKGRITLCAVPRSEVLRRTASILELYDLVVVGRSCGSGEGLTLTWRRSLRQQMTQIGSRFRGTGSHDSVLGRFGEKLWGATTPVLVVRRNPGSPVA